MKKKVIWLSIGKTTGSLDVFYYLSKKEAAKHGKPIKFIESSK